MNLYLVRHGLSTGNAERRLQGQWDTDLTTEGRLQAGATGRFLAQYFAGLGTPVTALYSSDLKRALHTAEAIGRHLGLTPIPDPGLREMHAGRAEGLHYDEWVAAYPEIAVAWKDHADMSWGWPGGETRQQLAERVGRTMDAILARHQPGDTLIAVTHGGTIRAYVNHALTRHPSLDGAEIHAGNCSIHHVQFSAEGDTIGVGCLMTLNERGHLDDLPDEDSPDPAPASAGVLI